MIQYELKQVLQMLQISCSTYKNKKAEILDYLSFYWDYDIIPGYSNRPTVFQVVEEKHPLEPYPKYQRISDKIFEKILFPIIAEDPLQTPANLARIVYLKPLPPELTISQVTFERHTRKLMKLWFGDGKENFKGTEGHLGRKIWVTLVRTETGSYYQKMTEEQTEDFLAMCHVDDRETMEAISLALNDPTFGEVQLRQVNKLIGKYLLDTYIEARQKYNEKYGGYPLCVREKILDEKQGATS